MCVCDSVSVWVCVCAYDSVCDSVCERVCVCIVHLCMYLIMSGRETIQSRFYEQSSNNQYTHYYSENC